MPRVLNVDQRTRLYLPAHLSPQTEAERVRIRHDMAAWIRDNTAAATRQALTRFSAQATPVDTVLFGVSSVVVRRGEPRTKEEMPADAVGFEVSICRLFDRRWFADYTVTVREVYEDRLTPAPDPARPLHDIIFPTGIE